MLESAHMYGCLNHLSMGKEDNTQREDDYFQNLPDELLIFIFTLLSSSNGEEKYLDNIKLLCRCSCVSKRFNSLTCLIPTLSIAHANIDFLYMFCPEILKKFKHIRSLQVAYWSRAEIQMVRQGRPPPIIYWGAAYRPHSYCLAVISYKKHYEYCDDSQKQQCLMLSAVAAAAKDNDFFGLIRHHTMDMIYLHHMLVSLIRDHKYLQRVVVTDLNNRGTLTLDEDTLVELRNCNSTNLEQVLARDRCGFVVDLDVPFVKTHSGVVMNNVCFNIIEWWEKATDDHILRDDDDDDKGVPSGLPFNCPEAEMLTIVLTSVMENADDVKVKDGKVVVGLLSDIKSEGYLL